MKKVRKSTISKLLACNLETGEMVVSVATLEDDGCTIKSTGEAFLICGERRDNLDKEGALLAVLRMPEKMVNPETVIASASVIGVCEFSDEQDGAENLALLRTGMDKNDRIQREKEKVTMPEGMTLDEYLADKPSPRLSVVH